jgi:hypothetical protein
MKVLVIGDVVGSPGRNILKKYLEKNKNKYDFIIVNGENAAAGFGITGKIADEFFSWGCDVITSGNHIWDKKEIYEYLDRSEKLLRPYNYPNGVPGNGYVIAKDKKGNKIAVISLQGRVFMPPIDCPFTKANELVEELRKETRNIIIDFHAEATSEKIALAKYLDGKISVLYGTHTHIQTADNKILADGTGYITDVGMTGSDNGVIGMSANSIVPKFISALPQKFEIAEGNERLNGLDIVIDDETGECSSIERINLSALQIELM